MQYNSKQEFPKDEKTGKTILGSAEAMKRWVELGFEEQEKDRVEGEPYYPCIDLRNCILYVSYPIGQEETSSRIFNFCDVAGIIPGTENLTNEVDGYLFKVNLPILFDRAILNGAFFHYVHFKERVTLSEATILHSSCFRCRFDKGLFAQQATVRDTFSWDQCEFGDSVYLNLTKVDVLTYCIRDCEFKGELNMSSMEMNAPSIDNHPIDFYKNSIKSLTIKNLNKIDRDICVSNCKIEDFIVSNPQFGHSIIFISTELSGIGLIHCTKSKDLFTTRINELIIDRCNILKQVHIEQVNIPKFGTSFCTISSEALFRISECEINEMAVAECVNSGCLELKENEFGELWLDIALFGHIIFQKNKVNKFGDRNTARILKHEALECNDRVSAIELDRTEKAIFRGSQEWQNVPLRDKFIIWLDYYTNYFGNNWILPLCWMIGIVLLMTAFIFSCSNCNQFNFTSDGVSRFFHGFLSNLNIFSIADFDEISSKYQLTPIGQALWLFTKVIVTYLAYQCIVAFRKYNRNF